MTDSFKTIALENLLPMDMVKNMQNRTDLQGYDDKMKWIHMQMENEKSVHRAKAYNAGKGPSDMQIGICQGQEETQPVTAQSSPPQTPRGTDAQYDGQYDQWVFQGQG